MTGPRLVFVCVRLILLIHLLVYRIVDARKKKCEDLTIPMCQGLGYNVTYMPNRFHQENQREAALEVHQFWPLVSINCSPVLRFFLCSLYAPVCDRHYGKELLPCRSVCEQAKTGCLSLMKDYGFIWPEKMECHFWPTKKDDPLCLGNDDNVNTTHPPWSPSSGQTFPSFPSRRPRTKPSQPSGSLSFSGVPSGNFHPSTTPATTESTKATSPGQTSPGQTSPSLPPRTMRPKLSQSSTTPTSRSVSSGNQETCQCSCQEPFVIVDKDVKRSIADIKNCALPCNASYFLKKQKQFATTWVTVWSTLCFISTFLTLSAFFLDPARFGYPERPVILLSGGYLMLSFGYILRLFAGEEAVICDNDDLIAREKTSPPMCTIVFFLTYFGSMASALWWVILSFTWFLGAGVKMQHEFISKLSTYFHTIGWLIPFAQTIAGVSSSAIDGDSLSGSCYVGNQSKDTLFAFLIIPLAVYLTIGNFFLVTGFLMAAIRRLNIHNGSRESTLEKPVLCCGIFSAFYSVTAIITIGCYVYEMKNHSDWEKSITCRGCWPEKDLRKPEFSAFMVKYFMSLIVGVGTGFWICSMKTAEFWRDILRRFMNFALGRVKSNRSSNEKPLDTIAVPCNEDNNESAHLTTNTAV